MKKNKMKTKFTNLSLRERLLLTSFSGVLRPFTGVSNFINSLGCHTSIPRRGIFGGPIGKKDGGDLSRIISGNSMSILLHMIEKELYVRGYKSDEETQLFIENLCFDQFELLGDKNTYQIVEGYEHNSNKKINEYLFSKWDTLSSYIDKLKDISNVYHDEKPKDDPNRSARTQEVIDKQFLTADLLKTLGTKSLTGGCIYIFYACLTYWESAYNKNEDDDNINTENLTLLPMAIKLGKELINKFLYKKYVIQTTGNNINKDEVSNNDIILSFKDWKENYLKKDANKYLVDDTYIAELGCRLLDVLEWTELVRKELLTINYKEKIYVLKLVDENIVEDFNCKRKMHLLPFKLPMVVPPKEYSNNKLGGYLLNNIKFVEPLITPKYGYSNNSIIGDDSPIYKLVNGVSKVPYKINTELLDFALNNNKFNLLLDPNEVHKYQNVKGDKVKESIYKSHVSKILLQETILGVANLYRKFSKFYIPVKLDQRGRMYTNTSYITYQGSELAKALLLFAIPCSIHKSDYMAINYLKAFGANSFDSSIAKKPLSGKIQWVDDNIENIINYENGILLSNAKNDPLLFLAFCIEYKRLHSTFELSDSQYFNSYLPIQVDATCNGFQHMALLSNEQKLFKELNLVIDKDSNPKDFYSYILHKLLATIDTKLRINVFDNKELRNSLSRLNNFIWNRNQVKKAIMTVPYNASHRSIKKHIISTLPVVDSTDNKLTWYGDSNCMNSIINDKDIDVMVNIIFDILLKEHINIEKLVKYLRTVGLLFGKLNLPIVWTLPSGLQVSQSYLQTHSIKVIPFSHSRITLNIRGIEKEKYSANDQKRSLMPNLIHSLDAASMALLYDKIAKTSDNICFFSVHDCFGVPASEVEKIKTVLTSVYIELYSTPGYIKTFDAHIINMIKNCSGCEFIEETRTVKLPTIVKYNKENKPRKINPTPIKIPGVNWLTDDVVSKGTISQLSHENILI